MDNDTGKHWWYCLTHHEVEGDDGCPGKDRLGPYATREEASMLWNSSRSGTGSGMRGAATTSTDGRRAGAPGCRAPGRPRGPGLSRVSVRPWQSIVG